MRPAFRRVPGLHVSDLALLAPASSDPRAPVADLNGVPTTTRVAHVEVAGCAMTTGTSARRDRACLRIRQTEAGQAKGHTNPVKD